MQSAIASNAAAFNEQMVGTIQRILVHGVSRKSDSQMSGRTENNRVVNFTCDLELTGLFVDVKITEAYRNSLQGEFVEIAASDAQCLSENRELA